MNNIDDYKFIRKCFELAVQGEGFVTPNPLVGSVIVKDAKIISDGFHKKYGGPHAEAQAIAAAKQNLFGATLYCNLEPCCHNNKQTPPCVPQIIESGIKRVVISNPDPNPFVSGKGMQQLIDSGIDVKLGVLAEEGEEINRFYFKSVRQKNPYITIKIAQSKDGMINSLKAEQTRITSEEAEIFVHKQRAIFDAVLVGANTINIDNPGLSVRRIEGRNPIRVIVDGMIDSDLSSNVYNDELINLTWVFTSKIADRSKKEILMKKGIRIFELDSDPQGYLNLEPILSTLNHNKITSLFVEGGAEIFNQFISKRLFDELIILEAPVTLGEGIKAFKTIWPEELKLKSIEQLGPDEKRVFRKFD
ncbi:MAG: bifunctional diaminohydroxyphosphoribosylaminopyrimidine deaminase/5-amino-6-(5-phosphoribosylamino)uracil reductase RibD [Melioribacteraceae bacterium]